MLQTCFWNVHTCIAKKLLLILKYVWAFMRDYIYCYPGTFTSTHWYLFSDFYDIGHFRHDALSPSNKGSWGSKAWGLYFTTKCGQVLLHLIHWNMLQSFLGSFTSKQCRSVTRHLIKFFFFFFFFLLLFHFLTCLYSIYVRTHGNLQNLLIMISAYLIAHCSLSKIVGVYLYPYWACVSIYYLLFYISHTYKVWCCHQQTDSGTAFSPESSVLWTQVAQ